VRSERGTQFRQWATERLREYLVKGFTMDDQRLKNPPVQGSGVANYFDELLERIRDIRASEKRVYLRVREIFALAGDYDPGKKGTLEFFQTIQNKLHFAATGRTAPELIAGRVDHAKPNMGLTVWKGDAVRKADVTVAKNYLNQDEIFLMALRILAPRETPRRVPREASLHWATTSRDGNDSASSTGIGRSGEGARSGVSSPRDASAPRGRSSERTRKHRRPSMR
jgi:hypothetical protein